MYFGFEGREIPKIHLPQVRLPVTEEGEREFGFAQAILSEGGFEHIKRPSALKDRDM